MYKTVSSAILSDPQCSGWLYTNVAGSLKTALGNVKLDEAAWITTPPNGTYAFIGGTGGDVAGVDIILNLMTNGTNPEVILHEIAHWANAPNFVPEGTLSPGGGVAINQGLENANDALLKEHCAKAISSFY